MVADLTMVEYIYYSHASDKKLYKKKKHFDLVQSKSETKHVSLLKLLFSNTFLGMFFPNF